MRWLMKNLGKRYKNDLLMERNHLGDLTEGLEYALSLFAPVQAKKTAYSNSNPSSFNFPHQALDMSRYAIIDST